ncbi:hypothetical protein F5I97DRAFT_1804109 [Phlebopus sp. FC_14]|nr:hypothetical protein F5I97DRAFT_1804109 [Phlebopus sp. FC_14]
MKHPDGPSNQQPDTREASPATDQRQHISQFHETVAPQSTPILPFARPYSLPDSHTKAYGTSIAQAGPSQPGNWIDRTSTASLPLPSQTPYNLLPRVAGSSSSDAPMFRNHSLQSLFNEASERRHLPAPPSINTVHDDASKPSTSQHLTPSEPAWTPQATPSSPPPPYSRFLSPEEPIPSTRSLSRTSSSTPSIPAPEAPVILTPPPQNEGSSDAQRRAPYNSFLCHAPPPDTWIAVETFESEYRLLVRLPGFRRDGITIATRRRRILHVVADSWEPGGGHFERRVSFGYDADLAQVRAEFDGQMLRIIVPRRPIAVSWHNAQ